MAKYNGGTPFAPARLTRMVRNSASQAWHVGVGAYSRIDREAKSRVFEARSSASEAWERLETAFVQRVARALNALQIPTARDVHELNARVEALQKAVVALERRAAEAASAAPGPSPGRRRQAAGPRAKRAPARPRKKAGT